MPCGVETTQKIAAILRASDRPVRLVDLMQALSIKKTAAIHGIENLIDTGTPIVRTPYRRAGQKGRPEYGYSIQPGSQEVPIYWGPNPHRVQSYGHP